MSSELDALWADKKLWWSIAVVVGVVGFFNVLMLLPSRDISDGPEEPPYVASGIPYIGHIIGLLRYGNLYYRDLRCANLQCDSLFPRA